jgi:hypothetical protein
MGSSYEDFVRSNVTETSNVVSADALARMTPASAVRLSPNVPDTSFISQPADVGKAERLSATVCCTSGNSKPYVGYTILQSFNEVRSPANLATALHWDHLH